jgi:hypothetical protein
MNFTFDLDSFSDLHKSALGFRPGSDFWQQLDISTDEQKQTIWDNLISTAELNVKEEERRELISAGDFERGIRHHCALGSPDRESAIKQMLDSVLKDYDLMYGGEYACFVFGLPYSYTGELDPIVKQIALSRNFSN